MPDNAPPVSERWEIARCLACGASALVEQDRTIRAACDCSLRDPSAALSVAVVVPETELKRAERERQALRTAMDCPPWDENERLRAALGVVEAAQLRGEVPASVIRDVREALRAR